MSIKITFGTTKGFRLSAAIENEQENDCFLRLLEQLFSTKEKPLMRNTNKTYENFSENKDIPKQTRENLSNQTKNRLGKDLEYNGCIHFKCPYCKTITDTNMRKYQKGFTCPTCGNVTQFTEPLQQAYLKDGYYTYWTNCTEKLIEIKLPAGDVVQAYFDESKQRYEG